MFWRIYSHSSSHDPLEELTLSRLLEAARMRCWHEQGEDKRKG